MKRIIYTTEGGGVAVVIPADTSMGLDEVAAASVPNGVQFEIVDAGSIPSDRTFRNAWERTGKAIGHNLNKAREIAHDKRRAARAAEFAPLDVEATIPAKAAQAEAKRQAIRDRYAVMQTSIDAAKDIDQLKAAVAM